jgi:hypothetical protein
MIKKIRTQNRVTVFVQRALLPIQTLFKTRNRRKQYQMFKQELKSRGRDLLHKFISRELSQGGTGESDERIMLVLFVNGARALEIVGFDINTFDRYYLELAEKQLFAPFFALDAKETSERIAKFLDVSVTHKTFLFP